MHREKTPIKETLIKKLKQQVFLNLKIIPKSHSNLKEIQYTGFQIQEYMITPEFTNQEVLI